MHIAVEGCSHGELDIIYNSVESLERNHNLKIDLLLCCGDFQSVRNEQDLKCMAVPVKYMAIQDFYKYHSGEKVAPVLTIFIGGNHEASNYLQELPYGGWVAPNIYYLGYAGMVTFGGLRIGGMSGIYKGHDYLKGHYEMSPYAADTIRSVYHVRNLEVFRLKQMSNPVDVFMSHDWPRGIYHHGNKNKLIATKRHFKEEIENNSLGSKPAEEILKKIKPKYWFSGHLHVKFAALFKHPTNEVTKFLALDKCLPRREFLQVLEVNPTSEDKELKLKHDAEWLTILRLTNHLSSSDRNVNYMPGPNGSERYNFTPTAEDISETIKLMGGDLTIPPNFISTAPSFNSSKGLPKMNDVQMPKAVTNPQTNSLCEKLSIDDPMASLLGRRKKSPLRDRHDASLNKSELDVTNNSESSFFTENASDEDVSSSDIVFELSIDGVSPIPSRRKLSSVSEIEIMSSSPLRPIGSLPKKRLNLSFPVNKSLEIFDSQDSSCVSSQPSEGEDEETNKNGAKRISDSESTEDSADKSTPSGIKKFKRRNLALYSSTDEDC